MKKIFDWIFAKLGKVGKDKYQHIAVGSILAAVLFVLLLQLGRADVAWWLSLMLTFGAALGKEFIIDAEPDARDIAATMIGWLAVGVPTFFLIF